MNDVSLPKGTGGLGGQVPSDGIRDTRLLARAVTQRWPITDEMREAVVKRLAELVEDQTISPRETVSAARALISADEINVEQEHGPDTQNHVHIHQGEQVRQIMEAISLNSEFERWARDRAMGEHAAGFRELLTSGKLEIGGNSSNSDSAIA